MKNVLKLAKEFEIKLAQQTDEEVQRALYDLDAKYEKELMQTLHANDLDVLNPDDQGEIERIKDEFGQKFTQEVNGNPRLKAQIEKNKREADAEEARIKERRKNQPSNTLDDVLQQIINDKPTSPNSANPGKPIVNSTREFVKIREFIKQTPNLLQNMIKELIDTYEVKQKVTITINLNTRFNAAVSVNATSSAGTTPSQEVLNDMGKNLTQQFGNTISQIVENKFNLMIPVSVQYQWNIP